MHCKDWCWSSNSLATWCKEVTHWKRTWWWGRLKAGEGDDRGWAGWMASPSPWTWAWASSGSWWWTGKPGVLQSMGSLRVRHGATELTGRELVQESDHWLKNENHTLVSAALQVPKARRKRSSSQRKKGVAFNGTATLRADFSRKRKSEDNGLASVKCWKTNNHQPGIRYPTNTLFESASKIKTCRTNGNETIHHPQTWTKKILRQCFGRKKSRLWLKYKKQVKTNIEVTVRVNINATVMITPKTYLNF